MTTKPNILLVFTDQQRFDTIRALGNPSIRTPALDRLCASGVAFTSAYSPSPVCVPARCSLHYGQYPVHTRCFENGDPMPADRPSFMDVLAGAGYRTHGIGKCHFTPDSRALRGFQSREIQEECPAPASDDYTRHLAEQGYGDLPEPHAVRGEMYYVPQVSQLPARLHPTQWIGDRSVAFIEAQRNSRQPWMLFSSFIHPHPPFAPPAPWHKLYRSFNLPLPNVPPDAESLHVHINKVQNRYKGRDHGVDTNLVRNIKAHYYACVSFIDYQVGRMLAALEGQGQLENTLIVFTSDHGELLGDYNCYGKRSMHDSCARVPLIVSQPGRFEGGRTCARPASLVDVMPTLLAAAGCNQGSVQTDGVDLLALLRGEPGRRAVYAQYDSGGTAVYTAVTERWKYAYSAPDNREFLFDRLVDPLETRNRAALPGMGHTVRELREQAVAFHAAGGDPAVADGKAWKVYPRREMPADPDAGFLVQDTPGYVLNLPGYTG